MYKFRYLKGRLIPLTRNARLLLLACCLLLPGCAWFGGGQTAGETTLNLNVNYNSNDGKNFYILLLPMNSQTYVTTGYQDAYNAFFAKDAKQVFIPLYGKKKTSLTTTVTVPEKQGLAVYALFRDLNHKTWRMYFANPQSKSFTLTLNQYGITTKN